MRVAEWNKILLLESCGGYYGNYPCKAHTCNLEHMFCKEHNRLLRKWNKLDAKKHKSNN